MCAATLLAAKPPPALTPSVSDAFADAAGLIARQRLYQWQVPQRDLPALVAAELPVGTGDVIDVGCGNGVYLRSVISERPDARAVGVDISHGMLLQARVETAASGFVAADAAALPFRDGAVSAAIAMHVLYLAADPFAALAELFRVVRSGGVVIVGTSARDDKEIVQTLLTDALRDLGAPLLREPFNLHRRFDLAAAVGAMREIAGDVAVHELRSEVRLTTPEPLLGYVDSLRWFYTDMLSLRDWPRVIARVREAVAGRLTRDGVFRIPTHTGVVVAHVRPRWSTG
jgi:SAM-dependent methyltransferase